MQEKRILMDMPVVVEVLDGDVKISDLNKIYDYFKYVDETFSTFKSSSEVSRINRGELLLLNASLDVQEVFKFCEQTKLESKGYYDINHNGKYDPLGLVKGWAIYNASKILDGIGFTNYYVEAGGDIQVKGQGHQGDGWHIGIRNPLKYHEIVKTVRLVDCGIATSGISARGQHIYNPFKPVDQIPDIVSLTVIGPNVYEADRFATPAFAMGKSGINFIEERLSLEGYLIDKNGIATYTSGFNNYVV